MASKQSEAVKELYRSWAAARANPGQGPAEPGDDHWGDLSAEPRGVDYIETDAGGVPAMWAAPKAGAHYRLAPEHTFPAQLDDATTAYRWLLDQGVDAKHIALAGDSCGGGLCVTTQLRARELGLPAAAALPSGLGGPSQVPPAAPTADPEVSWLQPIPDALVTSESDDPAAIAATRESLRLALIASLQYLPARQRAVLLLREVLAFPAAEVAAMLETTTAAVKSTLQRARARLDQTAPAADQISEPTDPAVRALLDRYIAAFESADAAILEQILRADAALEMVPSRTWLSGRETCLPYLAQVIGTPADWRMVPVAANGQPAVAAYLRGDDDAHRAFGVAVLTITRMGIARIVAFGQPDLVARFDLPTTAPLR